MNHLTKRQKLLAQWFTPPRLADRLWNRMDPVRGLRVLEPAAGRGALIRPMFGRFAPRRVVAYEIDARLAPELRRVGPRVEVRIGDFLKAKNPGSFDLAVMNPPYEDDRDVAFLTRALEVAPRVIGIFRSDFLHGVDRWNEVWRHVDIVQAACLVGRPRFSESPGVPMSDFVALHVRRRRGPPRELAEPSEVRWEWWA